MKSYINIILFVLALLLGITVKAQQNRRYSDKSFFHYSEAQFVRQHPIHKEVIVSEDSINNNVPQIDPADTMEVALYSSYVKQHGWMRGLGHPITEEKASHLYAYYRFSQKNKAGHWTKMECFDAYGNPSSCGTTYLINPFDDNDKQLDENWRDKLKQIVYWEFVGDNTGNNCVQENAYNKDGELILSYTTVCVGENKYMGHYIDAWGMPAKMRNEQGAKYVVVQRDINGYDADISFIGDEGFYKQNNWDAYRSKYIYNEKGYLLQHMSVNVDGKYMRDRAGNSGMLQTYDECGNIASATNVDEYEKVMRVPLNKTTDKDFVRKNYKYDKWGRDTLSWFSLADGITPDTITGGVHAYRYQNNDQGKRTLIQCLGLDGKPITDKSGFSMTRRDYDMHGNEIFFECRNSKGEYFNNTICLGLYEYQNNILIEEKNYKTTNGQDTLLTYHFIREGNKYIYEYPKRDWKEIKFYDKEDNLIESVYSLMDGTPQNCNNGYHRMKKIFKNMPGRCIIEECYWDKKGKLADIKERSFRNYIGKDEPYNRLVTIIDSMKYVKTFKRYDNDKLLKQFQQLLSRDFKERTGERSIDAMGQAARSHYSSGLYYNAHTGNTIKGGFSTAYVSVTNEYDEISYRMSSDNNSPTVYAFNPFGVDFYVDEYGNPIKNQKNFHESLPRAFIIEVYDSLAINLGIQSGDVIMEYGNWKYPKLGKTNYYDYNLRETIFETRNQKKKMVIMRRNPETNKPEVKEISLGKGTLSNYGFFFYQIYSTQKEKDRYDMTYESWHASNSTITQKRKKSLKKDSYSTLFMSPLRSDGNNKNIFSRGTVDDAIVLALAVQDKDGGIHTYNHTDSIEVFDSCRFVNDRIVQKIWFTTDLRTIRSLDLTGKNTYWDARFWYSKKNKLISKSCNPLYKKANQQMNPFIKQLQDSYTDSIQGIYGDAWQAVKNDSVIIRVAKVNADEGFMIKQGYKERMFVILEWCDWTCYDNHDTFAPIFKNYRNKPKHLVLLSVDIKDNKDYFTDIIEIKSDASLIGMEIGAAKLSYSYVKENIFDKYKEWKSKRNHQ